MRLRILVSNEIILNDFNYYIAILRLMYYICIMGITKSEIFTDAQNEIASIAKVLGHPARVAILQHIIKTNSCICGDLVEEIGLAQPTISQHLKELKRIGLIKGSIEGTSVCYCIDTERFSKVKGIFSSFMTSCCADSNSCC